MTTFVSALELTFAGSTIARAIAGCTPGDLSLSLWARISVRICLTSVFISPYPTSCGLLGSFPMATFQAIGPATIEFTLEAGQNGARTLMIAVSLAFAGGRPQVMVNNFAGPIPPVPDEPDSRGVTRGTWRGNVSCLSPRILSLR